MPLIRYPGSKEKLAEGLWRLFPDEITEPLWSRSSRREYREPFFGSGAIGFRVLERLDLKCAVWLNDIDVDLMCLWRAVRETPKPLLRLVHEFTPSVDAFYDFKQRDGRSDGSVAERGFRKLALHRMSVSGFGVKSGGPIGGRSQSSAYTVDCRWSPSAIKKDVTRLTPLLRKFADFKITSHDCVDLIKGAPESSFIYLDPPYYEKGSQLYKHALKDADHERLRTALMETAAAWVLSYDDHHYIRSLYEGCDFVELETMYTNAVCSTASRPKNKEIAISRFTLPGATP